MWERTGVRVLKMNNDNQHHESNNSLREVGVSDSPDDMRAQWLQKYILEKKNVPEHLGITIRVIKKHGRYYVSEWRTGKQSFSGKPTESHIARISSVPGKKDRWELAWMPGDMKWHSLGKEYQGIFEHCAKLIIHDPNHYFWG